MKTRVAINGFGRIGRLLFRILWNSPDFEIVLINKVSASASMFAYLLNYDSIHGTFTAHENELQLDQHCIAVTQHESIAATLYSI